MHLFLFDVVVNGATVYVHDLRCVSHAHEFDVLATTRAPHFFTEYAGGLSLRRVHGAMLRFGASRAPFTDAVTPRPTLWAMWDSLKASRMSFGSCASLYLRTNRDRNRSRTAVFPESVAKTFQAQDTLLLSRGEATATPLIILIENA
jgi:hypothetical protein